MSSYIQRNELNRSVPPKHVTLAYRELDGVHTFSAVEVVGLVVMHHDLRNGYEAAVRGVGELVSDVCGCPVEYFADQPFEEFEGALDEQADAALQSSSVRMTVAPPAGP